MIRKLRNLSLALIAIVAINAMAASVASAQQGELTWKPIEGVTLGGTDTGAEGSNALTSFGTKVECAGSTYTGHAYNATPHTVIPNAVTTVTITPQYKEAGHNCKGSFNWPITVDMNGCDYVAHLGETTGGVEGTYGVTFDVVCPAGKEITVTMFTNTTDETSGTQACVFHIKPQSGLKGAHVIDTGNGHLDITGTVEGIHVTKTSTGHTILCAADETTSSAKLDIDITVSGKDSLGAPTAISLSD